ncbi:hypothetical protein DM860_000698 [Cuscuta australis]|uniref:Alpha/beta hydrolase fold-3 domain-containing protein n=1 Tax=Cuscuta australis TaxID=267555 RepID=A0A328CXP0_9ASTE|nr:hypothetical protein DM860_000698 [Cuscuta australis]
MIGEEIAVDLSPFIRVYKGGRVERLFASPRVAPSASEDDSETGGVSSKDVTISADVSARIYLPKPPAAGKLPILVYFHFGGFCLESAFSFRNHRYLNALVSESGVVAVSVEYRLAPEHPLPAAYDDAFEALRWVASHAAGDQNGFLDSRMPVSQRVQRPALESWLVDHGDIGRIFLAGDSAGGNIVHNVAMRAGKQGIPALAGGILCFPYFWGSTEKGGKQGRLSKTWDLVCPTAEGGIDSPMINPTAENAPSLSGLDRCPKILVCVAEKDDLREIGVRYVGAVKRSGWKGKIDILDVEGEGHCFQVLNPDSENAKRRIASFISA